MSGMNSFKLFFSGLDRAGRAEFAVLCGTTPGLLNKLIYGGGRVELGLADVMVAVGCGRFVLADLPLTERAKAQHAARTKAYGEEATNG